MIHWIIERDEKGVPKRLVTSSAIQSATEKHFAEEKMKEAAQAYQAALPMPSMQEWAKKHGIIN